MRDLVLWLIELYQSQTSAPSDFNEASPLLSQHSLFTWPRVKISMNIVCFKWTEKGCLYHCLFCVWVSFIILSIFKARCTDILFISVFLCLTWSLVWVQIIVHHIYSVNTSNVCGCACVFCWLPLSGQVKCVSIFPENKVAHGHHHQDARVPRTLSFLRTYPPSQYVSFSFDPIAQPIFHLSLADYRETNHLRGLLFLLLAYKEHKFHSTLC